MSSHDNVTIRQLKTGVPGLDEILGGGLPEFSFNIIAGSPGGGKTTLAHQIVFANATVERPALFFTVLGEPALKMLRYQQQFGFFQKAKLGSAIRFVNLSQAVLEGDLESVLATIIKEVEAVGPAIVVVDSFRTVVRRAVSSGSAELELQGSKRGGFPRHTQNVHAIRMGCRSTPPTIVCGSRLIPALTDWATEASAHIN